MQAGGESHLVPCTDIRTIEIIAEIGINHGGSAAAAKKLIDAAAAAGVDKVKFQYRNLTGAYSDNSQQIGDEILKNEIDRNYLPPETIVGLSDYARSLDLKAGISFFLTDDLGDFAEIAHEFDFLKVPSAAFENSALIARFEKIGLPCIISTGAQEECSVRHTLERLDPNTWTVLHCISNYPVAIGNSELGYLEHLRKIWSGAIGYSSHDRNWEVCLLALQHGVSVIERHITLDKQANGLDHSSSSTPDEFHTLAQFCRNLTFIESGNGERSPNQGERLNLQNLGRSFYAKKELDTGHPIVLNDLVLRSPRIGLTQDEILAKLPAKSVRYVSAGSVIDTTVFDNRRRLSDEVIAFARECQISLPVRFHDFAELSARIPIGRYEFHLSFGDLQRRIDLNRISAANTYSIHMPDYVDSTHLVDLLAPDSAQRDASQLILDKSADFARQLQDRTGEIVLIVGSVSTVPGDRADFHARYHEIFSEYRRRDVTILPQWLPPIAWYFGGAECLVAMNDLEDVRFLREYNTPICMDICHLALGESYFGFNAVEVFDDLAPLTQHIHISDAIGQHGEGIPLGQGDEKNQTLIERAVAFNCVKVIEVWQGHLDNGLGFERDLQAIYDNYANRH